MDIKKNRLRSSAMLKCMVAVLVLGFVHSVLGQTGQSGRIKWLRANHLHVYFSEQGSEVEHGGINRIDISLSWPAEYGLKGQSCARAKGLWLGCKGFYDINTEKEYSVKVVGVGPRYTDTDRTNQIREGELKLLGRFERPSVTVDFAPANFLELYDQLDEEVDATMPCDRMIVNTCHSVLGLTMTRKMMTFTQSEHANYHIYDYVFKNTGIILNENKIYKQTLKDVRIHFIHRYAFSGESLIEQDIGWGMFNSHWGINTVNHVIGTDPTAPDFKFRALYAWYGPHSERPIPLEDDWGCPNEQLDGVMAAAKYGGVITLHADTDAHNKEDDPYQPVTTGYLDSDDPTCYPGSQFDVNYMSDRYAVMTFGHPERTHAEELEFTGISPAEFCRDGGIAQGQGFGPYQLEPGDSIHIVLAEGIAGIDREKNREVGWNWYQWFKGMGNPTLIMPNGSQTTDYTDYKRAWVQTGVDSLMKTFENAKANYEMGYAIPQAPPPPSWFNVQSGGDRIALSWNDNATLSDNFDGYVIYRSKGVVMDPDTRYEKIFECSGGSDLVHTFDDVTAERGNDYYYYIQSKSDGSDNDVDPGEPLYSSLFWTITNKPANLLRPAIPETPIPPVYDNISWSVMLSQGEWISGSDYNENDAVSYNNLTYVCIVTHTGDTVTTTPDINMTNWRLTTDRGEWVSCAGYNKYDVVTYEGLTYVCLSKILAGKGLELIRVVPNPYDIRSRELQFGKDYQFDRIVFYGLPAECIIKIYTERGDLVWEKMHAGLGSGDEYWDSKTKWGQIVVSGLYIAYFETPDGRSTFRKFIIIR